MRTQSPKPNRRAPATSSGGPGELALIERIRRRAAALGPHPRLRLGIGDDCAILAPRPGHDLLVTTDLSLEGRHFRRDWHTPHAIGHRTLARGLSDLAAMGARPVAAFLSLALPRTIAQDPHWLDGFLDGLLTLAALHSVPLAGGDTSESPSTSTGEEGPILADITLLGEAPSRRALRRDGASAGDLLYVTGSLGGAATELATIERNHANNPGGPSDNSPGGPFMTQLHRGMSGMLGAPSIRGFMRMGGVTDAHSTTPLNPNPHLYPQPRLITGQALLRRRLATACIDTSDGLSTDLAHLCTASHVAAEVDAAALPLHPLTTGLDPTQALHNALHGGEDYELLFTAAAHTRVPRTIAGVPLTPIGRIVPARRGRPQMTLLHNDRRSALTPAGWEHLK